MAMVLIAGFHRSGTSLLARMFHAGGLFLGNDLLAANESNPYGHFEDTEIVGFHDRVLKANSTSWQFDGHHSKLVMPGSSRDELGVLVRERNLSHQHWGLKDPRLCLFLKAWVEANPDCWVVAIFRDFISTTRSLLKRHTSDLLLRRGPIPVHLRFWEDPELPYRMWLAYNTALLETVRVFRARTLTIYHAQLITGLDVPAALRERSAIGMMPLDVGNLVDPDVIDAGASRLPPISADLRARLVQTWRDIESIAGASGLRVDEVMERAFEYDDTPVADGLPTAKVEFDDAIARYKAELARYNGLSSLRK